MGVNKMISANISRVNIERINAVAREGTGELFKINGDYFTIVSLAMYLLREDSAIERATSQTQAKQRKYIDMVDWMIRWRYLKCQIYPYRIIITEKFKNLYDNGYEIRDSVEVSTINEVKQ